MIEFKQDDAVAYITLNRPDKRNALNLEMLTQLKKYLDSCDNARVIVIRAKGPSFCSGMDLVEATDLEKLETLASVLADVYRRLYESTAITIALVQGAVFGGGAGLSCACDIVLSSSDARFSFPEIHRGIVPAQIMSFLVRQVKQRHIRELVLLGDEINAAKAAEVGLINRICNDLERELDHVLKLALKGAPHALKETKALIDKLYPSPFREDLMKGFEVSMLMRNSEEMKEGIAAFLGKRTPGWVKDNGD